MFFISYRGGCTRPPKITFKKWVYINNPFSNDFFLVLHNSFNFQSKLGSVHNLSEPPPRKWGGGSSKILTPKRGVFENFKRKKGGLRKFLCKCPGVKNKYALHYIMMFLNIFIFFQGGVPENLDLEKGGVFENFDPKKGGL